MRTTTVERRECPTCSGRGTQRCGTCGGGGAVAWQPGMPPVVGEDPQRDVVMVTRQMWVTFEDDMRTGHRRAREQADALATTRERATADKRVRRAEDKAAALMVLWSAFASSASTLFVLIPVGVFT